MRARHDTNVAKFKRVNLALDDVYAVSAFVHQIDLGKNSDCAFTLRIDPTSKLKCIRVSQVLVSWCHSHDNRGAARCVAEAQVKDLALNVVGLATLGNFRHSRQVNKCQVDN